MHRIVSGITTLNQHVETLFHTPEVYRPHACPHCGMNSLWRHGCYHRKADRGSPICNKLNPVPIPRFCCPGCRHTCSRLPACIAPRRWYGWEILAKDLSAVVEFPQSYRLSGIPRSIPWDQVEQVLMGVDRRSVSGKRDYAMLLLLATYGLRACEVAALQLDDIDWRRERMRIRERKAGNHTTYPLSAVVGAAIIDYLKNGRPVTEDRHVFLRTCAPLVPIGSAAVTCRAAHFIRKAGINVPRPGSHTLRHSWAHNKVGHISRTISNQP